MAETAAVAVELDVCLYMAAMAALAAVEALADFSVVEPLATLEVEEDLVVVVDQDL